MLASLRAAALQGGSGNRTRAFQQQPRGRPSREEAPAGEGTSGAPLISPHLPGGGEVAGCRPAAAALWLDALGSFAFGQALRWGGGAGVSSLGNRSGATVPSLGAIPTVPRMQVFRRKESDVGFGGCPIPAALRGPTFCRAAPSPILPPPPRGLPSLSAAWALEQPGPAGFQLAGWKRAPGTQEPSALPGRCAS